MVGWLFRAHGELCASHPWEVIVATLTLTVCMLTVDQRSVELPPDPHVGCGWRNNCAGLEVRHSVGRRCRVPGEFYLLSVFLLFFPLFLISSSTWLSHLFLGCPRSLFPLFFKSNVLYRIFVMLVFLHGQTPVIILLLTLLRNCGVHLL